MSLTDTLKSQEEPMERCQDGIWKGVRYFTCRQGHAFFCPVSSLAPDQRFIQNTSAGAAVNRELVQLAADCYISYSAHR